MSTARKIGSAQNENKTCAKVVGNGMGVLRSVRFGLRTLLLLVGVVAIALTGLVPFSPDVSFRDCKVQQSEIGSGTSVFAGTLRNDGFLDVSLRLTDTMVAESMVLQKIERSEAGAPLKKALWLPVSWDQSRKAGWNKLERGHEAWFRNEFVATDHVGEYVVSIRLMDWRGRTTTIRSPSIVYPVLSNKSAGEIKREKSNGTGVVLEKLPGEPE